MNQQQPLKELILIGYWSNKYEPYYPYPKDLVDTTWDVEQRYQITCYLKSSVLYAGYMGYSDCRFCGHTNGSTEYTDGKYVFPVGLAHYVECHGVRLPKEVEEYMLSNAVNLESVKQELLTEEPMRLTYKFKVNTDWWIGNYGDRNRTYKSDMPDPVAVARLQRYQEEQAAENQRALDATMKALRGGPSL